MVEWQKKVVKDLFRFEMLVFMSQENNSLITIVALKVKVMTIVGNSVGRFGNILTCMIPSVKPPLPSGVQTAL